MQPSAHAGLPTEAQVTAHEQAVKTAVSETAAKDGIPPNLADHIKGILPDIASKGKYLGGSSGAYLVKGERLGKWWGKATEAERKAMSADNILVDKDGQPWRIDNGGSRGLVWRGDSGREKAYADVVKYYKKSGAQLKKDMESVAQCKAAVQLLLENAQFGGNDKKARTATLFRTEQANVVGKLKKGDVCKNNVGPSERFSVFRTVVIHGANRGTIAKVPWSRINALYFMERTPGENDHLFLGDRENETNVDAVGLTRILRRRCKVW